ncbi:hypothetical protein [Synechococcus phage S-B64]|uniref:Gp219 n=2 Tax=Shandvirus TaxID=2948904 RepID=A0A1Z1LW91_9CAUD|nr:hypothetical protein KNT63_gp052 [Synechococcus phage S-H35]YP_010095381.1 hypothetical protein KNT88_gp143 [Synechococcus phage S-B64]ARW56933.1 hypothetical protein [Synechococcus phage S-H35]AWD90179.1 hypothetical protein [Synechococcus phage S-B64]
MNNTLWNAILAGALFGAAHGLAAKAEPTKGWYTMDAMGCMILQECKDGVVEVKSHKDVAKYHKKFPMSPALAEEFDRMMVSFDKIGVGVYIAPEKYFPPGHRGVYHTVSNNFFLNATLTKRYSTLMSVMRHEGWHAAQDCMAGSIKNSMIAIIMPEEDVPPFWREMVEKSYPPSAVPWEAEATWAGKTEGMTQKALEACANGNMWRVYKPTPLTLEWLRENNYVND